VVGAVFVLLFLGNPVMSLCIVLVVIVSLFIVESINGDAVVVGDRVRQRPDFLAVIVDDIHVLFLPFKFVCCG
jgi:hypothetical protein